MVTPEQLIAMRGTEETEIGTVKIVPFDHPSGSVIYAVVLYKEDGTEVELQNGTDVFHSYQYISGFVLGIHAALGGKI